MEFTEEQQKYVNDLVGQARIKARQKAEEDAKAAIEAAKQQAEAEAAQAEQVEALQGQIKAYDAVITGLLEARLAEFGEAAEKAVEVLPDSLTKLNWLNANAGLFQAPAGDGVGTPGKPNPTNTDDTKPGKLSRLPIRL